MSKDRVNYVIEWSPNFLTAIDTRTGVETVAANFAELSKEVAVGSVVVAISPTNVFIRTIPVPNLSGSEVTKIVALKLGPQLPVSAFDLVTGYRLGASPTGLGKLAIIGAMRAEYLRAIKDQAVAAGFTVEAVTPASFSSWQACREAGQTNCMLVRQSRFTTSLDVIANGELHYSRSIPVEEDLAVLQEEIQSTFDIAQAVPTPVLNFGIDNPAWSANLPSNPLLYLADVGFVRRNLFSFELPEAIKQAAKRKIDNSMRVSVAAGVVAITLAGLAGKSIIDDQTAASKLRSDDRLKVQRLTSQRDAAEAVASRMATSSQIVRSASNPAQSFGDLLAVLSSTPSEGSWFTGLTLERGKPISIRGNALTQANITSCADALSAQNRFRNVRLEFINKGTIGKKQMMQFAISGHAVGNIPIDVAGSARKK